MLCDQQDKDKCHKEVDTENSDDETSDSTGGSTGYKVKPVTVEKVVDPQSPNTERADAEIGEILDTLLLELPEVCAHIIICHVEPKEKFTIFQIFPVTTHLMFPYPILELALPASMIMS